MSETLEHIAQESSGCPIPGNVQGQPGGWSLEPSGLVKVVSAHGGGVGSRYL